MSRTDDGVINHIVAVATLLFRCPSELQRWTPIVGQSYKCILSHSPIGLLEPVVPPIALRRPAVDVSQRAGEKSAFSEATGASISPRPIRLGTPRIV